VIGWDTPKDTIDNFLYMESRNVTVRANCVLFVLFNALGKICDWLLGNMATNLVLQVRDRTLYQKSCQSSSIYEKDTSSFPLVPQRDHLSSIVDANKPSCLPGNSQQLAMAEILCNR